jgi:CDP-diacylglycerol--glycerol-3-phosphate 3-phosphatidyltransferase
MVCLVASDVFWWVPVAVIAFREISLTLYRSYLGKRGISLPARLSAKVKTVVQEVAVGFALLPVAADHAPWIAEWVLWAAMALTVWSGVQYLVDARRSTLARPERPSERNAR